MITAIAMGGLSRIGPNFAFSLPASGWFVAGLAMAGISIVALAVVQCRVAGTTIDPRLPAQSVTLVVHGVFRYSRNPMYAGFLLMLCAWGVWLGSITALLGLPLFVIYLTYFQIKPEERLLQDRFGEAYQRYQSTVRRWL